MGFIYQPNREIQKILEYEHINNVEKIMTPYIQANF